MIQNPVILRLENDPEREDTRVSEVDNFWCNIWDLYFQKMIDDSKTPPTFAFEITMDIDDANFYLVCPQKYRSIVSKKLNTIYPKITIKEVEDDHLGTFQGSKAVYVRELRLRNNQAYPLKMRNAERTFLNSLLNSATVTEEGEFSVIQIILSPASDKWKKEAEAFVQNAEIRGKTYMEGDESKIVRAIDLLSDGFFRLMGSIGLSDSSHDNQSSQKSKGISRAETAGIREKLNRYGYNVSIRIITMADTLDIARENNATISSVFSELQCENALVSKEMKIDAVLNRRFGETPYILSTTELTQFLHLPDRHVESDNVKRSNVRMVFDKNIPSEGILMGTSNGKPIALPMVPPSHEDYQKYVDNLCKPLLVLGQMGTGKSEWLINYMLQLIKWGFSVILVDPKNDTQKRLIETIPEDKMHLVDYINLGDIEYPAALNLLRRRNPNDKMEPSLITDSLVKYFKKEFGRHWGFALEYLIRMTGYAILTYTTEDVTMYEFQLMLRSKDYRAMVLEQLEQQHEKRTILDAHLAYWKSIDEGSKPSVRVKESLSKISFFSDLKYDIDRAHKDETYRSSAIKKIQEQLVTCSAKSVLKELITFWRNFHMKDEKEQEKITASTMNKVGRFMAHRLVRSIVSQRKGYDFRKAADSGRITIVNVPKGILQPENANLFNSFVNSSVWLDLSSRANIDIKDRYPTVWVLEEAHEVMDDEFIPVLTQSRGYRLGVTIVTQGLTNFDNAGQKELKDLLLTNCKKKIAFRVGHYDARILGEEFSPVGPMDTMNLPDYHFYAKILLANGKVSDTFFSAAPPMAKTYRDYYEFSIGTKAGKYSVEEIEAEVDARYDFDVDGPSILDGEFEVEGEDDDASESPKQMASRSRGKR